MMTDGINVEAVIEMYGIEVDDTVIHKLLAKELTKEEIIELVYDGISGNRMELNIVQVKVTQM
jgi:hypothetical protein